MIQLGTSHDRQIYYSNKWKDATWLDNLPNNNWLAFFIGEDIDIESFIIFADKAIQNNVLYLCSTGQNSELYHDTFDQRINQLKINKGESISSPDDFVNSPMTTWHNNFSEGFWFAITTAFHELQSIDKIVCIDFTKAGVKQHLLDLINKINNRWLPSDDEYEEPKFDI
jgi:hypothetical protein